MIRRIAVTVIAGLGIAAAVAPQIAQAQADDRAALAGIREVKDAISKAPGVDNIEQCSVAIRQQETKAENVVPGVKVVGNSWISLMSYQSRGYAYIRP